MFQHIKILTLTVLNFVSFVRRMVQEKSDIKIMII